MKGNDRGGGGFNVIRVCIGIMMLHALVEGANLEAWEKIYDHWELARPEVGLRKECKSDPCSPSCGNFDKYGNGHGVKCTDNYITIIALFTSSFTNRINGSIPAELGELKALTKLNLAGNQLTGSIPAELGELKALTDLLELSNNQLTGSIPAELGELEALMYLDLSNNQLTGSIPAELGELKALTGLELGNNQLTGSIPAELGELKALTDLDLSNNQLTGSIPAELGELKALSIAFYLKNNQLTPPAPRSVQALCIRLGYRYCKGFAPQCSAFINDKC